MRLGKKGRDGTPGSTYNSQLFGEFSKPDAEYSALEAPDTEYSAPESRDTEYSAAALEAPDTEYPALETPDTEYSAAALEAPDTEYSAPEVPDTQYLVLETPDTFLADDGFHIVEACEYDLGLGAPYFPARLQA